LSIFGEPADESITISRDRAGKILLNGGTLPIGGDIATVANTTSIMVFGLDGDDDVVLDESNGALPRATIFAGAGNDRIVAGSGADRLFGQAGNDTLDGRNGDDRLFGGDGVDILTVGDGADELFGGDGDDTIDGDRGNDVAFLDAGNDLFIWDPGNGSDRVEGEDGFDTLEFNTSGADETIAISANGSRAKVTRDIGKITMDVHGIERIELQPLGGADKIVVKDMTGTLVQEVRIDLEAIENGGAGDGKVDSITLDDTNAADFVSVLGQPGNLFVLGLPSFVTVQRAEAADRFTINGGAGNDHIEAGSIAVDSGSFTFDGGAGNDTLFGTNGANLLLGGEGNDFVDGQRGDDVAFLGAGDDTFVWERGDGNDVVEGGAGFDGVRLSGSSAGETFTVSAAGERIRVSADVDNLAMDANDVELISLLSFGGADKFVIDDLGGTDVETIDISLFDFGVPGGQ
jgi:Ca2+-binding RTX toxin-like protein